jgi:CheY-like chemotaxis protein/chemotaxis signal transduction protein
VGLDVVKENVESLGGGVDLETTLGHGTCFTLTAPIAMVFTRALVFRCGASLFAIPSENVDQVIHAPLDSVETVGGGSVLKVGERRLALVDLRTILGQKVEADLPDSDEGIRVVVVRHGGDLIAVRVDQLIGERQIVQRSFDAFLSGGRLLAGSAVLQSGVVAILLDVNDLIHLSATGTTGRIRSGGTEEGAETRAHEILVVDDSEITRDLIATILRNRGYSVTEAVNGQDALDKLADFSPDLVVTDLEMPILDGFGLVREMRATNDYKSVPIIVFSTRGSEGDRRKASEFGADAYIVKGSFREEDLLQLMDRFLGKAR